jgi:hypothetical protein
MKRAASNGGTRWFTVPEAARALGVGEEQIFEGIRGGHIHVRFEQAPGAGTERPLVTSEEIERKADVQGLSEGELKGPSSAIPPSVKPSVSEIPAQKVSSHSPSSYSPIDGKEVERLRLEVAEAEEKLDHALRSIYDRDVKVARLEAQLEAAAKVENAAHQYSERLEERLGRLEEASEDKEKEIRRLALTLGEARGEVKLLKGPTDSSEARRRGRLFRYIPLVLLLAAAFFSSYHMATLKQPIEAGAFAALGVLLAFLLGFLRPRRE